MNRTAVIFEQEFDKTFLEEISKLRETRIYLLSELIRNLPKTMSQLQEMGAALPEQGGLETLAQTLKTRLAEFQQRLLATDKVFEDEIALYLGLTEDMEIQQT